MESYRPDPICSCDPKCVCDAITSVMERKQQDRMMQFLRGLNDQFNTVRSNVLMMDPFPNIAKVFSYAVQQERQINSNELTGSISLINAAGNNSSNSSLLVPIVGKKIKPIMVKLPNGHTITATLVGKIQITQFLYLEEVLYISSFQYNLISVSKMVSSLPCKLTFMNDKCFI